MRPHTLLLAGAFLLAAPVAAHADPTLPEEVVAGQEVTLDLGTDASMAGSVVTLRPAVAGGIARVVAGTAALEAGRVVARFSWPARYRQCDENGEACGERHFFPGQRVDVTACSVPVTSGVPGLILASSQACLGTSTSMGGRAPRVRLPGGITPRRVGKLSGARWSGWGKAVAQARGIVSGRSATAVARDIVDCDGRLWYSVVEIRTGGRVQRVRDVAPC